MLLSFQGVYLCNLLNHGCCPGLLCQCIFRGENLSFTELRQGNECKIKLPEKEVPETVVSGQKRPLCRSGKALFCHLYSQILDKRVAQHGSFSTFYTLFPIFHASRKPAWAIPFTGNPPFHQPFPSGCCGPWQMGAISLLPSHGPWKPHAHRQTANYSRPRKLSPRQPEQRYRAAVTLLQLSRNNAPRLPEKPYSPLRNILYGSPPFLFQPITVQKRKSKGRKILASFCP